jgi:hypothetical protein
LSTVIYRRCRQFGLLSIFRNNRPDNFVAENTAMEVILSLVMGLLPFDVPFMVKYVDDILLCCPGNLKEETLEIFNSINRNVQFTMEVEVERKLPYLDLLLIRNPDGTIDTDFYMKPTASGRILNYNSYHSMRLKINTAIGLIRRIFSLSSVRTEEEKSAQITSALRKNGYPKSIIKKLINEYKNKTSNPSTERKEKSVAPASIPYIRGLTEPICRKIAELNGGKTIGVSCSRSKAFSKMKDPLSEDERTRCIYSIPCLNCLKRYIGLVWRQYANKRKKQHVSGQKHAREKKNRTALEDHVIEEGHQFDFSKFEIIDGSNNYNKLKLLEMIHITTNETVNKRSDVSNAVQQYAGLIHHLKLKELI